MRGVFGVDLDALFLVTGPPATGAVQRVWDAVLTSKNRFLADTPKVCFEHLWEQMHCLQVR